MDRERVLALLRKLKASRATELEVSDGDLRVRIVRAAPAAAPLPVAQMAAEAGAAPVVAPVPAGAPVGSDADHHVLVVSHVVGFFRRSREAGGKPLAEPGQSVSKGQPLAVVEALRRAVVIDAPVDGELIEFLAEDGARVEYGSPVARLEPTDTEG